MKTTSIPNLVSYLLGMIDTLVLLVAWPSGKKGCKGVDFTVTNFLTSYFWRNCGRNVFGVLAELTL